MSANTSIEWADHTFNPWSGCAKVSSGCTHCYAAALPPGMRRRAVWGPDVPRVPAAESYWRQALAWDRAAAKAGERRRVFCASTADVFEDRDDLDALRIRLAATIQQTPNLDWLLLTKRADAIERRAAKMWATWPSNVWVGVSVEDQAAADQRVPHLLRVPASVRFLSMEPLLGPVDLRDYTGNLDWVIVGGESGPKARPMHPSWIYQIYQQCRNADVSFFFKQWGEWCPRSPGFASDNGPRVRLTICGCNSTSDRAAHGVPGAMRRHDCDTSEDVWMGRVGRDAAGDALYFERRPDGTDVGKRVQQFPVRARGGE